MKGFMTPEALAMMTAGANMIAAGKGGRRDLSQQGLGYGLQQGLMGMNQGMKQGLAYQDKFLKDDQRDRILGLLEPNAPESVGGAPAVGATRPGLLDDASPAEQEFVKAAVAGGDYGLVADYVTKQNQIGKPTQLMMNAAAMGLVPGTPEYNDFITKGTLRPDSMINMGNGGVQVKGDYAITQGEDGKPVMTVIPGSETHMKQQALKEKEGSQQERTQGTAQTQVRSIGEARKIIEDSPTLATGFLGNYMKNLGGTDAANLDAYLSTIEANISFDYLQSMRNSSPTGGALGQVSERELALLGATAASVKQSQSSDQLLKNLEILERQFLETIHGKDAADKIISDRVEAAKAPEDAGIGDLVDRYAD